VTHERRDVADRRLIFSINSGRCGSQFLSELLGSALGVHSRHEPEPKMNGVYVDMINRLPYSATRNERAAKCVAIANVLRKLEPWQVYAETTHMFIKTFFDVVLEDFTNVEVIVLRRNLAAVLKSFVEMGYFSERNPYWSNWMSSPHAATAARRPPRPEANLDQYDRCIAYLLDIEARGARFKREYPRVPTYEVDVESLNTYPAVEELFASLRISPGPNTREVCQRRINARDEVKHSIGNSTTLDICVARLQQYRDRAED
jgi:hypothetical protein